MSKLTITPDQIKSIAAEMRRTEEDRLGAKLPNTTALNAITRSLGLGSDFRAFKASFEAKPESPASAVTMSNLIVTVENEDVDMALCSAETAKSITDIIEAAGFTSEITAGMHDVSLITAWSMGDKHSENDLVALKQRLTDHLEDLIADYEIGPLKGSIHWQTVQPDKQLIINFRYHENNQLCSATVSECFWKARHQLNRPDEFALLINGGEVEISGHYTVHDITIEDVLTEMTLWDGD
jgi:hypothetical protein